MTVCILEVDYGTGFEVDSVWDNDVIATCEGERIVTFSAPYVKYRVRVEEVRK